MLNLKWLAGLIDMHREMVSGPLSLLPLPNVAILKNLILLPLHLNWSYQQMEGQICFVLASRTKCLPQVPGSIRVKLLASKPVHLAADIIFLKEARFIYSPFYTLPFHPNTCEYLCLNTHA